jgi:hypothetical protein
LDQTASSADIATTHSHQFLEKSGAIGCEAANLLAWTATKRRSGKLVTRSGTVPPHA